MNDTGILGAEVVTGIISRGAVEALDSLSRTLTLTEVPETRPDKIEQQFPDGLSLEEKTAAMWQRLSDSLVVSLNDAAAKHP